MNLMDVARCIRPLLFETGVPGYEYSLGGTAFAAIFQGRYYIITAEHCLKGWKPEQIRVEFDAFSKRFLPFRRMFRFELVGDKEDWSDVLFFEISDDLLTPKDRRNLHALNLGSLMQASFQWVAGETELAVCGYPYQFSEINYETPRIERGTYGVSGKYAGPTGDDHCSFIRFDELALLHDLNGMSGAPVFCLLPFNESYTFNLAGVLLRGSAQERIGRFVNSPMLFQAMLELDSEATRQS